MAPHPMSDPGWPRAEPADPSSLPESVRSPSSDAGLESDFAELAAKFAAHGGDSFSADLSAELALEIILNEIVEKACLATGASGAAVVLERNGEMVCRASSGPTAPELGARLDVAAGLSGECLRAGLPQRCDDALADPRADAAASQRLGVRSVLVWPLVGRSGVVGLFQLFSQLPWAFGQGDERILEALAERVMKNLERAAAPLEPLLRAPAEPEPTADVHEDVHEDAHLDDVISQNSAADPEESEAAPVTVEQEPGSLVGAAPSRRLDLVGWGLGVVVLACTALLAVLTVERLGLQPYAFKGSASPTTASRRHGARPVPSAAAGTIIPNAMPTPKDVPTAGAGVAATSGVPTPAHSAGNGHVQSAPPAGSLLVFENGREVFRMPPSQGQFEKSSRPQTAVERASSVAAERVVALSPDVAESSLLHRVEPDYPDEARDRQLQGAVVVDIHIRQDGTVQETKLVSGEPLLADAAMAAVKQWRFQPRMVDGAPVEMQTRVTLNFRLSN